MSGRRTALVGCPGSGKTQSLLSFLEDAIKDNTPANSIGFFSFTKAGAMAGGERLLSLVKRLEKESGVKASTSTPEPVVGTLHSLANKAKPPGLEVLSKENLHRLKTTPENRKARVFLLAHLTQERQEGLFVPFNAKVATLDSLNIVRNRLQFSDNEDFQKEYENAKAVCGFCDFNDLLFFFRQTNPPDLDLIAIDEAQDLTPLQWLFVDHMVTPETNLIIAGDPDQTLYENLGVNPEEFLKRIEECDDIKKLEGSYRCPQSVVDYAVRVLETIDINKRADRGFYSKKKEYGKQIRDWNYGELFEKGTLVKRLKNPTKNTNQKERMRFSYRDIHNAYLTFTRAQEATMIRQCLKAFMMPLVVSKGRHQRGGEQGFEWFIKRREIEKLYEKLFLKASEDEKEPRPSGEYHYHFKNDWNQCEITGTLNQTDEIFAIVEFMKQNIETDRGRKLFLDSLFVLDEDAWLVTTINQAKGLEFPIVVLRQEMNKYDRPTIDNPRGISDEGKRTWFVGATRASEQLLLHTPDRDQSRSGVQEELQWFDSLRFPALQTV